MCCISVTNARLYKIKNDAHGVDVVLQHGNNNTITGNVFKINVSPLYCCQSALDTYNVLCNGKHVADIVFGTQAATIDPIFKLINGSGISTEFYYERSRNRYILHIEKVESNLCNVY